MLRQEVQRFRRPLQVLNGRPMFKVPAQVRALVNGRFSSSVTQNFICIFRFPFAIVASRLFSYQGLGCSQQA